MKKCFKLLTIIFCVAILLGIVSACSEEPIENYFIVTFKSNNDYIGSEHVKEGESVSEPEAPTKQDYSFIGWYENSDFSGEKVVFPYTPTKDTTLYAKWQYLYLENGPVSTVEDLLNISLRGNYYLANDIDLGGMEWTPMGTLDNPFIGRFDGKGYTITNFSIVGNFYYAGLFGYNEGNILNLGVENFAVDVESFNAGGLAGFNSRGTIKNCYATGNVNASFKSSVYVGGLVGSNGGTIENCYAFSNVNANTTDSSYTQIAVGGLVGENKSTDFYKGEIIDYKGLIINCNANGKVNATAVSSDAYIFIGGLVGCNSSTIDGSYASGDVGYIDGVINTISAVGGGLVGRNSSGTIKNSYATGNVSTLDCAGGLVGDGSGDIKNCHATGNVTGDCVGGLIGRSYSGTTIKNSYATGNVTGDRAGGLAGQNSGTIQDSYATGNISSSFESSVDIGGLVGSNGGIIKLSYAEGTVTAFSVDYIYAGGLVGSNSGIIQYSYAIGTVNAYSTGNSSYAGGLVGSNSWSDKIIENCYAVGAVSATSDTDSAFAGGLVGRNNGIIKLSHAEGAVTASSANWVYTGGLVGHNYEIIENCYAVGAVSTANDSSHAVCAGGLAGANSDIIKMSYAEGTVTVSAFRYVYAGGLVGNNYNDSTVENSYATGNVEAYNTSTFVSINYCVYAGGLVGINRNNSIIRNSFAVGNVDINSPSFTAAGGLVGRNYADATIENSFAIGDISSIADSAAGGGLVGLDEGVVNNSYDYEGQRIWIITFLDYPSDTACTIDDLNSTIFYNKLGWDSDIWNFNELNFGDSVYPTLVIFTK